MKKLLTAAAMAATVAFAGATGASAQAETALVVGSITATQVIAGVIILTVVVAVADDGTVTTTTVEVPTT